MQGAGCHGPWLDPPSSARRLSPAQGRLRDFESSLRKGVARGRTADIKWTLKNKQGGMTRMARPRSIDDQEILQAAQAVFLERGISGTTAEVAERAGVSEGSIFNRFGSKRALFHQALKPNPELEPWVQGLEARIGQGDLRDQLVEITTAGIEFFRRMMPLMMMLMCNPQDPEKPSDPTDIPGDAPIRVMRRVAAYFEAEKRLGRLRDVDTEILARAILAGMTQYAFFEALLRKQGRSPLPVGVYAQGLVDVLWNGVAPRQASAPRAEEAQQPQQEPQAQEEEEP